MSAYHPIEDFAEDHMLAIQPRGLGQSDEELGAIGVGPSVGHADPANAVVFQLEVLVWECLTIDAYTCMRWKRSQQVSCLSGLLRAELRACAPSCTSILQEAGMGKGWLNRRMGEEGEKNNISRKQPRVLQHAGEPSSKYSSRWQARLLL